MPIIQIINVLIWKKYTLQTKLDRIKSFSCLNFSARTNLISYKKLKFCEKEGRKINSDSTLMKMEICEKRDKQEERKVRNRNNRDSKTKVTVRLRVKYYFLHSELWTRDALTGRLHFRFIFPWVTFTSAFKMQFVLKHSVLFDN